MAKKEFMTNNRANEAVSKFKLLSAYGGPGSIVHTEYGSIIISCIEEWGFIQYILEIISEAEKLGKDELEHVRERTLINYLNISNDDRLLQALKEIKKIENLRYLSLIPDIELNDIYKTIKDNKSLLAINSTFMPKGFYGGKKLDLYKQYKEWYNEWPEDEQATFFPPKYKYKEFGFLLKQDNIVLICNHGHISDFPWSKYLKWKIESPDESYNKVDLYAKQDCCNHPIIQIRDTTANASGFDGKWLKCNNKGCAYAKGVSLKGLMSVKIICQGHKPWEAETGDAKSYFGRNDVRKQNPKTENCKSEQMKVALTTGNNLYYSRLLSSIYMPNQLFLDNTILKIRDLKGQLENAKKQDDFAKCMLINAEIKELEKNQSNEINVIPDSERELNYRYQEFVALKSKSISEINVDKDLIVEDVTNNLDKKTHEYFSRVLRIDNLKITSAQLDFSRVEPASSDSEEVLSKNIFRSKEENVLVYPVVENYGEGIFFALNEELLNKYVPNSARFISLINKNRSDFARSSVKQAEEKNWQLYLVHSFCHLLMRELEFRCGYPTASLSERIFVSNDIETKMHGFMIYTSEGAEGSMGGLIAQTRENNINALIKSALIRATVCNSDPLCWESDGQGLFELNLASCFSCSLVSETSCELRNLFLDRRILVDEEDGFFKELIL